MIKDIGYATLSHVNGSPEKTDSSGVSIIVPTLNEAENIDFLLKRICAVMSHAELEYEIIIVDGHSADNTRDRVSAWFSSHPVKLVCREGNGGLASAIMAGCRRASFETIIVMDADLSHPPEKIPDLIKPVQDGLCDVAIGSRYVEGGTIPDWPLTRKIASQLASVPACLFTDVKDPMAGFFATSRKRINNLRSDIPGFKIGLELLVSGGDELQVMEIPIVFHDRFLGFSKMTKNVIFDYFKQVIELGGIHLATFSIPRLATFFVLGILIDFLSFIVGINAGYEPVEAHLSGLILSWLFLSSGMYQLWRGVEKKRKINGYRFFGLIAAVISAIGIQAGVYKGGIYSGFNNMVSFFPASIAAHIWLVGVLTVFVYSDFPDLSTRTRRRMIAVACILFAALIRIIYLGLPGGVEQEAYYWYYSRDLGDISCHFQPFRQFFVYLGTGLTGITGLGVRLIVPISCWLITTAFSYCLTSRIFGRTAAVGSVLLLSSLPVYFGSAFIISPETLMLSCWSALLFLFYRVLVDGRESWLWIALFLGIGMITDYSILLILPPVCLFMLLDRKARQSFFSMRVYYSLIGALLIAVPVIYWSGENGWQILTFSFDYGVPGKRSFQLFSFLGVFGLVLTPFGVACVIYFFLRGNSFFNHVQFPKLSSERRCVNRSYLFLLLTMVLPLIAATVFCLFQGGRLSWVAPFWLSVMPFLGFTALSVSKKTESAFLSVSYLLWNVTVFTLLFIYIVFLHHTVMGNPLGRYPVKELQVVSTSFATAVEDIEARAEKQPGEKPSCLQDYSLLPSRTSCLLSSRK